MSVLEIIIASTRPGRLGLPVGRWFYDIARQHGAFDARWADLAEINLPFLDEPKHPRFQDYQHQHTKDWAARIDAADAFVIVTPEYNFGTTAPLVNALDYLSKEWKYKAAGFVTYGAISGGTRSAQMAKGIISALGMMPIPEAVNIPMVAKQIEGEGNERTFNPPKLQVDAANHMLNELMRWTLALRPLRKGELVRA